MSFHHRANQQAVFSGTGSIGGGGSGAGTGALNGAPSLAGGSQTDTSAVTKNITTSTDDVTKSYQNIFAQQMEQQAKLYSEITKLNNFKNAQSSYLSLAKGVSEMV